MARLSKDAVDFYRTLQEYGGRGTVTLEQIAEVAQPLWRVSYALTPKDYEAVALVYDYLEGRAGWSREHAYYRAMLEFPHEQLKLLWAIRWVDQVCPRIVVDEKYSSLLMCTDVRTADDVLIAAPWGAFVIMLPSKILPIFDDTRKKDVWVRRVFVQHVEREPGVFCWNFIAESDEGMQLWRHGMETAMIVEQNLQGMGRWDEEDPAVILKVDERDERVLKLVGKLILSVCLAMSDPHNVKEQKRKKGQKVVHTLAKKQAPAIRTFVLGKPIKLDCRPALERYLRLGKGSAPAVRKLVRGHWKQQVYGPQGSLRKLVQIEPYWRGPEEGVLVSSTVKL